MSNSDLRRLGESSRQDEPVGTARVPVLFELLSSVLYLTPRLGVDSRATLPYLPGAALGTILIISVAVHGATKTFR